MFIIKVIHRVFSYYHLIRISVVKLLKSSLDSRVDMKILATADIHEDTRLVERLVKKSKDADVIVIAGDLTWAEQ